MCDLALTSKVALMSGLSDLLQHLNTEGWSTRRIEKEATKHGHKLSNATAARYLGGRHPARPNHETLQAFADLFGTDVQRLREAAGLPGGGTPFELGPEFSRLNGPQREAIRTVARLYLEQNDELESHAVDDGSTALRERVLTYVERHLLTDENWPDYELLPVDLREKAVDMVVDHGVEIINSSLIPEEVALPHIVEQASSLVEKVVAGIAGEAPAVGTADIDPGRDAAEPIVQDLDVDDTKPASDRGPTKADFSRAAMSGHSQLEADDAAAAERGEGSQDHGGEEPA